MDLVVLDSGSDALGHFDLLRPQTIIGDGTGQRAIGSKDGFEIDGGQNLNTYGTPAARW